MTFHTDETPRSNESAAGSTSSGNRQKSVAPAKCSLCGKAFDRTSTKTFPFCSSRCRQIDLGNWLNESYGFPVESADLDLPEHE